MTERTTYTTARIRAEALASGDVALIGGTWVWVRDCIHRLTDEIREEYAHLPDLIRDINSMDDPVFVAVVYLHTPISHSQVHYAYSAGEPGFRASALSVYDLVEIQVPVPKEV